jgi:hypothetical protein
MAYIEFENQAEINIQTLTETLRRPQWIIWLLAAPVAFLPFLHGSMDYFLGYFPSMIVHELGHMLSGWIAGVPSISFFFASLSFLKSQSVGIPLVAIGIESIVGWYAWKRRYFSLLVVLLPLVLAHLYFVLVPTSADWFIVFGGMGGELVLPVVFCLLSNDFQVLNTGKLLLLHGVCYLTFWHSLYEWIAAAVGVLPIPYPPDSSGAPALFQDPFSTGVPVGDLDKLTKLHGFTDESLIVAYTTIACFSFGAFLTAFILAVLQPTLRRNRTKQREGET